jgi:aryl carrier-like protein
MDEHLCNNADMEALLSYAFERYFTTSGLFGTPETCLRMVDRLKAIGVDEIGCLIDFGVDVDSVLASLHDLQRVMAWSNQPMESHDDETIPVQIAKHHVTHMQCTPSMARMLLLDPQARDSLGALRTIVIGGEAFPTALASQLRAATSARLMNMYGPTETTIWSMAYTVDEVDDHLPIGRPIANTTIYILDSYQQPVPIGVAGELYIGGAGVVRGYLDRPELTAERFICDPFSSTPGARLYRTGDRARYLPDGNIEFLGRVDHQVKIRGHRIELGEIEAVLGQHPGIQEAVVMAREDTPGDQRLVAYIVPREAIAASLGHLQQDLRNFLTTHLPEYMVPAVFTILAALPLTPNGKVNRGALPAPEGVRPDLGVAYVPPQTALEEVIASIWQEVLQISTVGIHDNFFEVGGTSLLLVQVHSKLRAKLNTELSVVELFRYPTIHALAQYLSRGGQSAQPSMQHIQDRARRQMELRKAKAVNRQREFMEARRQQKVGDNVNLSNHRQRDIA